MNLHHLTQAFWQQLNGLMPGELQADEWGCLVSPREHMALLERRRATLIVNRVRLFAFLFAVLTPLWSLIDLAVFPLALWGWLALMRLIVCATFISLLVWCRPHGNLRAAYRAMALLFLIPTSFYVASSTLLSAYALTGVSAAIAAGYAFLPFVLLAGLAIFPLTLLENIIIASPILLAQAMAGSLRWSSLDWPSFAGAFWLMLLLSSVSAMAGMSQLAFMMALVRQSIRDPLTGVFSRNSAEQLLDIQFPIAQRSGAPLSIAFIDLDHFKGINDQFGHDAGDRALIHMTQTISTHLRRGDVLARWGGEEFVLIMPNSDRAQAQAAMMRMKDIGFGLRPDHTPLTASVGIAERVADHFDHWKDLVALADQRMYHAKSIGRNTVVSETAPEPDPAAIMDLTALTSPCPAAHPFPAS